MTPIHCRTLSLSCYYRQLYKRRKKKKRTPASHHRPPLFNRSHISHFARKFAKFVFSLHLFSRIRILGSLLPGHASVRSLLAQSQAVITASTSAEPTSGTRCVCVVFVCLQRWACLALGGLGQAWV